MSDTWKRYAKWAGDALVSVALVVCEATAMFGVGIVLMLIAQTGRPAWWPGPTSFVLLAVAAGIMAAGAWSVRLWVTAVMQILVVMCLAFVLVRFAVENT
ncbi:hypothetical protein ACFYXS_20810 [Streptomyces sp. NPDC002574]|uniref:hypothetical protein n=1 Tax=Streptomyces sp. NPDC002574 TaxID=3364652 RepID=UPI0036AC77FD